MDYYCKQCNLAILYPDKPCPNCGHYSNSKNINIDEKEQAEDVTDYYCDNCNLPLLYTNKPCPKCGYEKENIKYASSNVFLKLGTTTLNNIEKFTEYVIKSSIDFFLILTLNDTRPKNRTVKKEQILDENIQSETEKPNTINIYNYNEAPRQGRLTLFLLWFFLGWLAIHRFYANRVISGILLLIYSCANGFILLLGLIIPIFLPIYWITQSIHALWLFIDLILILTGNLPKTNKKVQYTKVEDA